MNKLLPRLLLVSALVVLAAWKGSIDTTPVPAPPLVYLSVYDAVAPAGHSEVLGIFAGNETFRLLGATEYFNASLFDTSHGLSFLATPPYPVSLRITANSIVGYNAALNENGFFFVSFRGVVYSWDAYDNIYTPSLGIGLAQATVGMAVRPDGKFYGAEPTQISLRDPTTSAAEQAFGHGATAVALGPDGDIYALDAVGNQIERYRPNGTLAYAFPLTTVVDPAALVVGPDGRLYVANGNGGGAVYDVNSGRVLALLSAVGATADGAGRTSLTLDARGYLYMYDAATGIHVFSIPPRTITVPIQIKNGPEPTRLKVKENGPIHVLIFASSEFNPVTDLDLTSLTFGRTGSEKSFDKCQKPKPKDSSIDCTFSNALAGFRVGDTQAVLGGKTIAALGGVPIRGSVAVIVVP